MSHCILIEPSQVVNYEEIASLVPENYTFYRSFLIFI